MKMGVGQLICLISGVLLLSLGGGLAGGRLAAKKHQATAPRSAEVVVEPMQPVEAGDGQESASSEPEPAPVAAEDEHESAASPGLVVGPGSIPAISFPTEEPAEEAATAAPPWEDVRGVARPMYVIQAMSTSNRRDASASRKRIMASGFPAGVFEADLAGKGKWYRVYVGPYENEADARLALDAVRGISRFRDSFLKALE